MTSFGLGQICEMNFFSPWDKQCASKMEYRALWDSEKLFFQCIVCDSNLYIDSTDN